MKFVELIIYGMAVWRTASLLVDEDGPFNIFRRLRELAGIQHGTDGEVYAIPDKFFASVLSCVWCCSVWVASFWVLLWLLFPDASLKAATALAFSTVAILIDKYLSK